MIMFETENLENTMFYNLCVALSYFYIFMVTPSLYLLNALLSATA